MPVRHIHIKKGRDLNIKGKPETKILRGPKSRRVAVLVDEFPHIKPKLQVAEGDTVEIGTCLFFDKKNPQIRFLSPGGGTVAVIERGERRAIQRIIIDLAENEKSVQLDHWDEGDLDKLSKKDVTDHLLTGGLWPTLRQRPFSCIANPQDTPRSIFINGMNTEPLAGKMDLVMRNQKEAFHAGVKVLNKLTPGSVYLSVGEGGAHNVEAFHDLSEDVKIYEFSGPHPAGTTSVHIYHIERLKKDEVVWTLNAFEAALIGWLFLEGRYPVERTVAVAGQGVIHPQHYHTRLGASLESLTQDNVHPGTMRTISGSVLTGFMNRQNGYLSFYKPDITVIPEGKERKFLGWISPGLNKLSFSRSFLSALIPQKPQDVNTNLHGSLRTIIATDIYDRYMPLDIYALPLVKAVIGQDIDTAERLGILECDPEDFALASFMDPSKLDVCGIIQQGLDLCRKDRE